MCMHTHTHMSVISKLLTGTLPLEVEVGRWSRTDKSERFCKICNSRATEDEYHFLFICEPLQGVRDHFYNRVIENLEEFTALPDGAKVRFLMEEVGIKEMGDYLIDMFDKRKEKLYIPNRG